MLTSSLSGRFVSLNTEIWTNAKGGGRRDVVSVLDPTDGKVYSLLPPRGDGIHPVVPEAGKHGFGVEVVCTIEQKVFAKDNRAETVYVLHNIERAPATAAAK
jgi:hypothetical protein